jgi:hypothetical protein
MVYVHTKDRKTNSSTIYLNYGTVKKIQLHNYFITTFFKFITYYLVNLNRHVAYIIPF